VRGFGGADASEAGITIDGILGAPSDGVLAAAAGAGGMVSISSLSSPGGASASTSAQVSVWPGCSSATIARPFSSRRSSGICRRHVTVHVPRSVSMRSVSAVIGTRNGAPPRPATKHAGCTPGSVVTSRGCSWCRFSRTMRSLSRSAASCWSGGAALK
jgi:hypothetical protein